MRKLSLLLVFLAPLAAFGQGIVSIAPQQCVWRAGDNPVWAAPNLDESGWQPYTRWKLSPDQPRVWVRCHADLSSLQTVAHPAIQVSLWAAYQLYVDGALTGSAGNLGSGNFSMNAIRSFPLPEPPPQPATIALRITYVTFRLAGEDRAGPLPPLDLHAGDGQILGALRAKTVVADSSARLTESICFGMIGVLGVVLLGLFLHDRSRLDLLLLSIVSFSLTAINLDYACAGALVNYSYAAYLAVMSVPMVANTIARPWLFFTLARRRVPLLFWILIGLGIPGRAIEGAAALLPASHALRLAAFYFTGWGWAALLPAKIAIVSAPFVAFWPYSRITRRMRPLAVLCMAWETAQVFVFTFGAIATLEVEGSVGVCVIGALLGLLFREQQKAVRERAELAGEMQAARNVQQYMIPEQLPATPGFAIESEYRPAREVGGDFFQVLPQPADGSLLIVVGDVAGKGIEAGMLAALIVGAVRTAAAFTSDPGGILALLNELLRGRGLVTCLALRVEPEGAVTLVNAGHLPPYLNGRELAIEGTLPLGAVPGLHFPVSRFKLAEGDTLILITDGVAEAQDAQGQLFGFERIGALLGNGATGAALAQAAQSFGQEDDITVLSLIFAPEEVLHD